MARAESAQCLRTLAPTSMAPVKNGKVIFNSVPDGYPEPGKTTVYDDSETIDLDAIHLNGGALIKVLELSVDPYFRGRMRDPSVQSYSAPFTLGQPLEGGGIGVVIRSENSKLKPGDHITGTLPHQQYFSATSVENLQVINNPYNLPWSNFVGVLGMPGLTAFAGWKEYAQAKKGETAFVTTGAGAVGSLVIQLAKLDGLKVIASAGSDEKVEYMAGLGADVVFNYKTTSAADILAKEGPIDIYWDNVGGETLDHALNAASIGARFIECGMISGYNDAHGAIRNIFQVVSKSISIHGFIVSRIAQKHIKAFAEQVSPKVASGEFEHREQVYQGLEQEGEAILAVQKGTNDGKAVVHVADDHLNR